MKRLLNLAWATAFSALAIATIAHAANDVYVTDSAGLQAAMVPANEGKRIFLAKAEYIVSATLVIPKGASLVGGGQMLYDDDRLPLGIVEKLPRLRSAATLVGDIILLSDGVRVSGLVVEEARSAEATSGNLVVAQSNPERTPVSAEIDELELLAPHAPGIGADGPTRRGLLLWTRNLNRELPPEPESDTSVTAQMTNSIVRAPKGNSGIYVNNFAPHAGLSLTLVNNVIGGGLTANGGTSRGDVVQSSKAEIFSLGNLYRDDSTLDTTGIWIVGCSIAPGAASALPLPSVNDSLRMHSVRDRIDGFNAGIFAAGGRTDLPTGAAPSGCTADVTLQGTSIRARDRGLRMVGAYAPNNAPNNPFAGDHNELRVLMRGVEVNARRLNVFANQGPDSINGGIGNRLEIIGNTQAYESANDAGDPLPPEQLFGNDSRRVGW